MSSEERRLRAQGQIAQFDGRPIYFFDTRYLLATARALADWNPKRLEAAIAPRVEHVLGGAGDYVAVDNGFYVVFASRAPDVAREKSDAICSDILTHFYGPTGHAAHTNHLRRAASIEELGRDVGLLTETEPVPARLARVHSSASADSDSGGERFVSELVTLLRRPGWVEGRGPLFSPIWDSRQRKVTAFACGLGASPRDVGAPAHTPGAAQCRADVGLLAAAWRGALEVVERGELALISVPVHAETLSWTKTRAAYVEVLGQLDSRARALIAPRIVGLNAGSNPADLALWARALRRHAHWVFAHLPDADIDMSRAGLLGITGFGITAQSARDDEHALEALQVRGAKLTALCLRQNAVAFAYDVASERQLSLLKRKGVRFMSGPVIGPATERPAAVAELSFPQVA